MRNVHAELPLMSQHPKDTLKKLYRYLSDDGVKDQSSTVERAGFVALARAGEFPEEVRLICFHRSCATVVSADSDA